jgi:hypothetical protein
MARPIKYVNLNKPELEYEVIIRLEEPRENLVALKKQAETLGQSQPPTEVLQSVIPPEEDLEQVETGLNYFEAKINQLQSKASPYAGKRLESFQNHLFFRLRRIDLDHNSPLTDKLNRLSERFKVLENKYEALLFESAETTPLASPHCPPLGTTPEAPLSSHLVTNQHSEQSIPCQNIAQTTSSPNIIPELRKLSYNGNSCPKSFLQKIEEFGVSRNLKKERLADLVFEIFTDKALHWIRFQKNRQPDLSWCEISNLLIRDFGNTDYDFKLLTAINARTQGDYETIIIYISIMHGMFSRLNEKKSESEQLSILLRNIRPCYSVFVALNKIDSIDSLISACQNYEHILDRDRNFKEPKPAIDQLASEFNYNPSTSSSKPSLPSQPKTQFNSDSRPPFKNYFTKQVNSISDKFTSNLFCVRCRANGHSLRTCQQPHFPICFKCGLRGFKTPDCPNCNTKHNSSPKKLTLHDSDSTNNSSPFNIIDWQNWLTYLRNFFNLYKISSVLYEEEKDHNRPFLNFTIDGIPFSGLLDSGSSLTILGNNSHLDLLKKGYSLSKSCPLSVATANNHKLQSLGYIDLLMTFNNQTHAIRAYAFPEIHPSIILGVDFWKTFNLIPELLKPTIFDNVQCNTITSDTGKILTYEALSTEQKDIAADIIARFKQISFEEKGELGKTHLICHKIDTGNSPPVRQRCYRLSPEKQRALTNEVDKMLGWKVIEPCESPWLSPVIITPKKNGEWRFCVDSRKLNSITRRDAYSLPLMNEILDHLRDAKYLSSIDIAKAFWEVPLHPPDRDKTAFYVPGRGMYRFVVMPFGLTNAPATQQRLMDALFTPEFEHKVFCYLDDIVIISKTFEEHISLLIRVLEKLTYAGLTINYEKSQFFKKELKYLGFMVDELGLRADPDKVRAVLEYPTPTTKKEIRRFHGSCSWFRRFIPNFSTIAAPLNKLAASGKNSPKFGWTAEANSAFLKMKELLVTTPILACPNFDEPFAVHCDASNDGIGAMLTQKQDNREVVIAYMSKSFNKHERNYSTTERETLAVISALEHWRCYVDNGKEFTVYTDHAALKWFLNLSNPSGRLATWALRLSTFNCVLKHKRGKDNVVPDLLSRSFDRNPDLHQTAPITQEIQRTNDEDHNRLISDCQNNPDSYPNYNYRDNKLFRRSYDQNSITDDFAWKEVPLPSTRKSLIEEFHGSPPNPHLGIFKTYKKLALQYYWTGMFRDVAKYISKCETCLAYKHSNHSPYGIMGKPKICSRPFQCISLDLVGPLPMTRKRNQYILVINCYFTKYSIIFPLKRARATDITFHLENFVFLVFGVPQTIIMDNGPQFQSREFHNLINKYRIPFANFNPLYCPQVNPTERYNKTLITALASLVGDDHRSWDNHLSIIQSAMNNSVNLVTGFTPSFLVFGRETIPCGSMYSPCQNLEEIVFLPRDIYANNLGLLSSIYDKVQVALYTAHIKNSNRYDLRRSFKEFNINDIVWRKNYVLSNAGTYFSAKLAPKYLKCRVIQKLSPLVYMLEDPNGSRNKWHIKDFKT